MVLYIHEIEFHRYSIWYIQGQGQGTNPTRKGRLPTTTPGCVWSMHRTGRDPRADAAGPRPTADGPGGGGGGGGGCRPHSSSSARVVMGARASRVDVEDGSASERIERGRRSAKIRVRDARRGDAIGG